jgi:hypothetical protein
LKQSCWNSIINWRFGILQFWKSNFNLKRSRLRHEWSDYTYVHREKQTIKEKHKKRKMNKKKTERKRECVQKHSKGKKNVRERERERERERYK